LAHAGAPSRTLVVADHQTQGRGRRGRSWDSSLGGAWFSLLLRPKQVQGLTILAALAVREACGIADIQPGIKWPNDILWQGRKLCGILVEASTQGWAVVGVGINVCQLEFPPELQETAISLQQATGRVITREAVIQAFCESFDRRLPIFEEQGIAALLPEYAAHSVTLGRRVFTDGCIEGIAERLGPQGELLLRLDSGEIKSVWAGDVSIRGCI